MNLKQIPFALALASFGLASNLVAADSEDARLDAFFRAYLDESFALRPTQATGLGDHRFDDRMDDLSPAARAGWTTHTRSVLERLPKAVDYLKLSRAGQVDYEILEHDLKASLWMTENFDPFATDPRVYSGYLSGSVFGLLTQSSLPKEKNIANAIARMKSLPAVVAAAKQSLKRPPKVYAETATSQNKGAISFYERDVFEFAGKTPQIAALREAALPVVGALKDYQAFLEKELMPRADGEWRIGADRFRKQYEIEIDAGITADQIYADAQAEFVRVRNELYVVARQLWSRYFPGVALPPDDAEGRRSTVEKVVARVAQEHGKPETLVKDITKAIAGIKKFIATRDILRLPEPDLCHVIEMPEFQRGNSTAYMNSPPPLDTAAVGHYAVSPPPKSWDAARVKSYLEEYNHHMLQILTIHEAYPGHYVQMEYANRNPSLIRKVLGSGVFIEGWAVYTEQTMLDQGYGDGNLALRLQQLKFYLRAVANTILDHRMHCLNMTDDEAMDLLVKQSFQSEGEARLKVIRSKQSSVQLSTYFTGRMAHYRIRQQVQREMGDRFVLGRFHEAVLSNGSVPVKYLPNLCIAISACPFPLPRPSPELCDCGVWIADRGPRTADCGSIVAARGWIPRDWPSPLWPPPSSPLRWWRRMLPALLRRRTSRPDAPKPALRKPTASGSSLIGSRRMRGFGTATTSRAELANSSSSTPGRVSAPWPSIMPAPLKRLPRRQARRPKRITFRWTRSSSLKRTRNCDSPATRERGCSI